MNTHEKVENYLLRLSISHQETGKNAWVVSDKDKGIDSLFIAMADSLIIMRTNVALHAVFAQRRLAARDLTDLFLR